jgi:uroporphyrin-III C-methyltransferase/precorrin-2 dehydrogenase/sirohydrochlorin ferrochelatase
MNAPYRSPGEAPARIGRLARLPVFFALTGKRVVVAGGSAAAAWKMELLSACGAMIDVYTAEPCEELLALAAAPPGGTIVLHPRGWRAGDLRGAAIAIGDCADDEAAAFAAAARAAGVPVNVIDRPAFCDFSFGSIVNRSPLVIGISTDGAAPAFAQAVRGRIETLLPQGFARWAAAASRWRAAVKASELSFAARRRFWQIFATRALDAPDHKPDGQDFAEMMIQARAPGSTAERRAIAIIVVDPDDAGLLTLRAVRALQTADVLVYDDDIASTILDFARREAQRIAVAPWRMGLAELTGSLAADGKRVVRLTSACSSEASAGSREEKAPNDS